MKVSKIGEIKMKIIALCGLLGYGYNEDSLKLAFKEKVDYVGVDAGSTDPGPYYLGSGKSFTDRGAVKRDLSIALPLVLENKAPFIIGTAGGAGSNVHTDWLVEIIKEIAKEKGLSFSLATIYSEVDREYVLSKLNAGKITDMSPEFPLTEENVKNSSKIVSQIGIAPIIDALNNNAQVIVCGRACDTAIYAAPCIKEGYDHGLAFHMAKIMECGAMCSEPVAAADVMQGYIEKDYFMLRPANPERRCTLDRVAAHTMYEQTNPYMIYEPDGVADLRETVYEQVDPRTVKVMNSKFIPAKVKTLKLEGVKSVGFRTITLGGINDTKTISKLDEMFEVIQDFVKVNANLPEGSYQLNFRRFGGVENNACVVVDVVGQTQEIADNVCAIARARLLHCDYDGRKSSAGNVAFPFSPSDLHVGEVFEFSVFHLAEVDDLKETSKTVYSEVK